MVYKHAVVAAFHVYAQRGEDAAKRGGWRPCISHGSYIVDYGKSWNCHFEFLCSDVNKIINYICIYESGMIS